MQKNPEFRSSGTCPVSYSVISTSHVLRCWKTKLV